MLAVRVAAAQRWIERTEPVAVRRVAKPEDAVPPDQAARVFDQSGRKPRKRLPRNRAVRPKKNPAVRPGDRQILRHVHRRKRPGAVPDRIQTAATLRCRPGVPAAGQEVSACCRCRACPFVQPTTRSESTVAATNRCSWSPPVATATLRFHHLLRWADLLSDAESCCGLVIVF